MVEGKVDITKSPKLGILLEHLNNSGIKYAVIGGIAISTHLKSGLATADLDIIVKGTKTPKNSSIFAVKKIMPLFDPNKTEWGYNPQNSYTGFGFESFDIRFRDGEKWWMDCLCANRYTSKYWPLITRDAKKVKIAGVDARIADLSDLVIIKFGLEREKDLKGIYEILKSNKLNIDRFAERVKVFGKMWAVRHDLIEIEKKYIREFPKITNIIAKIERKTLDIPFRISRKKVYPTREAKHRLIPNAELERWFSSLALDCKGVIDRRTARNEYPTVKEIVDRVFPPGKRDKKAWKKVYNCCIGLVDVGAIVAFYDKKRRLRFRTYTKYESRIGAKLKNYVPPSERT